MARDRYLWNAGEERIHPANAGTNPKSPKSKWENFWYYHKFHLLIALLVIALAAGVIYELTSKEEPDYQIALLTQTSYPEALTAALEQQIAQYGEDLNGDGRVLVSINSYLIVMEEGKQVSDPSLQMTSVARFLSDLELGSSVIYLTDETSFRLHQQTRGLFSNVDGSVSPTGSEEESAMWIPWKECRPLSHLVTADQLKGLDSEGQTKTLAMLDELGISLRAVPGTVLEQDPEKVEYYNASRTLFDRLVYGK